MGETFIFRQSQKQGNIGMKSVGNNFHQNRLLQILEVVEPLIEMLGFLPESFHFVQS